MSDTLSISLSVHPVFLPVSPYGSHAGLIFLPLFFPPKGDLMIYQKCQIQQSYISRRPRGRIVQTRGAVSRCNQR